MVTVATLFVATALATGVALADPKPQYQNGFAALASQIPSIVGEPLENEHPVEANTIVQHTSGGLMVWNGSDNSARFTDGQYTWVDGAQGVQRRLNSDRLAWEKPSNPPTLFQVSTINALMEGLYDGSTTVGDLKGMGDFGIGTFHTLDGEMVEIGGKVYRIRADGKVYPVDDAERTPFAAVTFFQPGSSASLDAPKEWAGLYPYIDSLLPSNNLPYAIQIDAVFSCVKARSVPPQAKPYPRLVDVTANQPTFEFRQVKGTLVGYRLPQYMEGVNVPGYHFHFLTEDRTAGGHLLEATIQSAQIQIDPLPNFRMQLPESDDFYRVDLSKDKGKELDKVER
jgi:acetolactate decarboxylase